MKNDEFDENRQLLMSIIERLGQERGERGFHSSEVAAQYRAKRHHVNIDGRGTISDYVKGLAEFGVLRRPQPHLYVLT